MDIWRRLSHPYPVRFLSTEPYANDTCFKLIIQTPRIDHSTSLLSYKGLATRVTCRSPLVQAAALWLQHLLVQPLRALQYTPNRDSTFAATATATATPSRQVLHNQHYSRTSGPVVLRSHSGSSIADATADLSSPFNAKLHYQQQQYHSASSDTANDVAHHMHSQQSVRSRSRSLPLLHRAESISRSLQQLQNGDSVIPLKVIWVSRLRFERSRSGSLTGWQQTRSLGDDLDIVIALQRAVYDWNKVTCVNGQKVANCRNTNVVFNLEVGMR